MKREIERFTARVRVDYRGRVVAVTVASMGDTWETFTGRCLEHLLSEEPTADLR